jgi:Golgi nucleoside diphosphatase
MSEESECNRSLEVGKDSPSKNQSSLEMLSKTPSSSSMMLSKSDSFHERKYNPKMDGKSSGISKTLAIICGIFLLGAIFYFTQTDVFTMEFGLSSLNSADASSAYNIRVLPASLSDAGLDALPKESFSYLAMIDAGSSGCRAHVYRYGKLGTLSGPLYIIPKHDSKKVKPGLSTFAVNPGAAGASLKGLVDFVKEQVPEADWATTPIWLKATAGLRMVADKEREDILESVRNFLGDSNNSPFIFRPSYAKVIPGYEEGGFGWIAFNYLKKVIGPRKKVGSEAVDPFAVVEMGGASTQVTQIASNAADIDKIPFKYRFSFSIEGEQFVLYTYSYLGYGAEQAREKLNNYYVANTKYHEHAAIAEKGSSGTIIKDACLNTGFSRPEQTSRENFYEGPDGKFQVIGVANDEKECFQSLQALYQPENTISDKCEDDGPYSFRCVYQPNFLKESKNFLVFENFFYTAKAVGIQSTNVPDTSNEQFPLLTTPSKMREASKEVCQTPWNNFTGKFPKDSSPADQNSRWCFSAAYTASFLTDGLGLADNKVVTIQKEVDGSEVEWALGAAYKEAATFLTKTSLRPT